jgi:2-hydroxymuconate-semialdehyde hydrolase
MTAPSADAVPGGLEEVDGLGVWCAVAGDGPAVLLLHGIPTSSYLWRNVQRPLSRQYWTIAPDLVGLGRTDAGDRSVRLDDQAVMVRGLLDRLGVDTVVVVAHDIGGAVAHHFIASNRDRVRAIVMMNVAAFAESWPVPIVKLTRAPVIGELTAALPAQFLLRRELRRGLHHPERMRGEVLDAYQRPIAGYRGRRRFVRFLRGMDADAAERALHAYVDLDVPRLILWGTEDPFLPIRYGERLHQLWPGSRLVPVAEASHFLQEDQPERVATELAAFLAATTR